MISVTRLAIFSFVAFLISFLLFPVFIKIFKQLKWFDTPGFIRFILILFPRWVA